MQNKTYTQFKPVPILLLYIHLLAITVGCQTSSLKILKVQKVANQQVTLISKIQSQRSSPEITKQVSNNHLLLTAEMDLNDALNAIKQASAEIAKQLPSKCTKTGGNDERY